ncbi:hypothetical protein [Porphyromonas sp.]|uniref:hypothetical protein n=1 Tax=Porphyromonas sp. TaxID=1924944 RepID=UPI0026DBD088|nr:hypothetical protein [Porphyromonas sp.]MDO4771432.1 hypothetical protein [Porphyromonas sp.]
MKYRNYWLLYLSLSLALLSCGKEGKTNDIIDDEPGIEKGQFLSESVVFDYFTRESKAESPSLAPQQMYREYIQGGEIEGVKRAFWELWRRAHEEEIKKSAFGDVPVDQLKVWDIPQDEKMQIQFIAKDNKPAAGYPLIINLHGGGRYPQVNHPWGASINTDEWKILMRFSRERYEKVPSFFVVPRMSDDRKGRWYFAPQIATFRKLIRLGVLSGAVDPERIYLTGISEGGYGTLRLGLFMPDCFSALGVLAAAENPGGAEVNLRHSPLRMEVGENDFEYARNTYAYRWQDVMKQLKDDNPEDYTHFVHLQRNRGHHIKYFDVFPWMLEKSRKALPQRVTYLYENIAPDYADVHGKYSDGVYFLDFRGLKTSSRSERMLFDVKKSGNTYEITTKAIKGDIKGSLGIFVGNIDENQPVVVNINGEKVYERKVRASRAAVAESISLYSDPKRIFTRKITVNI